MTEIKLEISWLVVRDADQLDNEMILYKFYNSCIKFSK